MDVGALAISVLSAVFALAFSAAAINLPPVFVRDMNNLALSEDTPVGTEVYVLEGHDPEGGPVRFALRGTDLFRLADERSGGVVLAKPLDRELGDTLRFTAEIRDEVEGGPDNAVAVPVTVIVTDENDNPPRFPDAPYEVDLPEDSPPGTVAVAGLLVDDPDTSGDTLELTCVPSPQSPEACRTFRIDVRHADQSRLVASLVSAGPLNHDLRHSYRLSLLATDGRHDSTADVLVRVTDVQNSPPAFFGPSAAALSEDAPVGTAALTVAARDGDRADPRVIVYDLLSNPHDYFVLDPATGELRTARPLDRESSPDAAAPLNVTVRAREVVDGRPSDDPRDSSVATVAVTLRDVNDEPPRFDRKEYSVEIPEDVPPGTPLPNLDMTVTDADAGSNSAFSLRLDGVVGPFAVEPQTAIGSTRVGVRLSDYALDYENPNRRKFIILVIAEELHTAPRLSSTATVTVTVTDVNDNAPVFERPSYDAAVSELAVPGTHVVTVAASDRDHGRFGTQGLVYELSGDGARLFAVDEGTGVVSVAPCDSPGRSPCLDFESGTEYFLNLKATDDDGSGQSTVAPLKISLRDANDNAPAFDPPSYSATVDEGAVSFDPELRVRAEDRDVTSVVTYSILKTENADSFLIDAHTGKMGIRSETGVDIAHSDRGSVLLRVQATDGVFNATCDVNITITDVNNNAPVFETDRYDASVPEDASVGNEIIRVHADDGDTGINSEVKYSIQNGAFENFSIDRETGVVKIASELDYDRKNSYGMQIIAVDQGTPALTGTAFLTVKILNENDKSPVFTPPIQRTEVSADVPVGTVVHKLAATDPDVSSADDLIFKSGSLPIVAVDKNGKQVIDSPTFQKWFTVEKNGQVKVGQPLDRNVAAVISLPVDVYDASAPSLQLSQGTLIVTVVDVNSSPPSFRQSYFIERFIEEQLPNTTLATFHATDDDSSISRYAIEPSNPYFHIDSLTGVVRSTQRIDYERAHQINFTVVAYDTGIPQLSTSAPVLVNVVNINDEEPIFQETLYEASVEENSSAGTIVLTTHAEDKDEGVFGQLRYSITGDLSELFTMDGITGELKVGSTKVIDREAIDDVWLLGVATDNAPVAFQKTATVQIHIKVLDLNDNPPIFGQRNYRASVAENLSLDPPAPILQVRADDKDLSLNGQIKYSIVEQTETGAFYLDDDTGVLYPSLPLRGNTSHHLKVSAVDGAGEGPHSDTAFVDILVESVNQHTPVWIIPPENQSTLSISENMAPADVVLLTLKATDQDVGENGRVTYFFKVGNKNVHETNEFYLNELTGELKTKVFLDRESDEKYQLVLVATDQGTPSQSEVIKILTVIINDSNDNKPIFSKEFYDFTISENRPPNTLVGTVKATDKDSGENGRIYYYIVDGNNDDSFTIDKILGTVKINVPLDREARDNYLLTILASNSPVENVTMLLADGGGFHNVTKIKPNVDKYFARVKINVLDVNDNAPQFEGSVYYGGVKSTAKINDFVTAVKAQDPDLTSNNAISYTITASNLYKYGSSQSSGSVVPSPFNITQDGAIFTAAFMAEYDQDRFVLHVVAQETTPPYKQTDADVYVWIVQPKQLIRLTFIKSCAQIDKEKSSIVSRLSNATQALVVVTAMKHYTQNKFTDGCDVYVYVVDNLTLSVVPVERAIAMIDQQYDNLKDLYDMRIDAIVPAGVVNKSEEDSLDPALVALIALLIVLFTGIVTFIVVCSCLKQWVLPMSNEHILRDKTSVKERSRRLLQELGSTDNPLWAEHKLRLYEEQELTMNVFGENNDSFVNRDLPPLIDNTYATIQSGRDRDYATLDISTRNTSVPIENTRESNSSNFEAMLGYQGSTFQPELPETPEPPPRSSYFHSG